MTFRLCHPHDFKTFHEYDNETGEFIGTMARYIEETRKVIFQTMKNSNISFKVDSDLGIGTFDSLTGKFDGCLGQMQENKSDVLFMLDQYGMNKENLSEGLIVFETNIVISQLYAKGVLGGSAQILNSFRSFSFSVYLMCLLTMFICFILLKFHHSMKPRRVRRRRNIYYLYHTLTHCARVGHLPSYKGLFEKMIFLLLSLFSLVVIHYFSTYIKTELVVVKDPQIFRSYKEIIDRGATPFFVNGMPHYKYFKYDNSNEQRNKFWEYATKKFDEEDIFVEMDPFAFLIAAQKILQQKAVIIFDNIISSIIPGTGCPMMAYPPEKLITLWDMMHDTKKLEQLIIVMGFEDRKEDIIRLSAKHTLDFNNLPEFGYHESIDPSERSFQIGILTGSNSDPRVMKIFHTLFRRGIETGYHISRLKRIERTSLFSGIQHAQNFLGKKVKSRHFLTEECFSTTIVKPQVEFKSIHLKNFKSFCFFFFSSIIIEIAVLSLEIQIIRCIKKILNAQKPRRRRIIRRTIY